LVLAALRGDAGKTAVSLSLIGAWHRRGLRVAPFKKGPDFIDPAWLSLAAGQPCRNLDAFLMDAATLRRSLVNHAASAQVAVIEGNRGLYDGIDEAGTFSTAELAKLLQAPVVLVLDCTKSTRTMAALVVGCQHLDPAVSLRGVILNQVAGKRHESVIRASIERHCGLPVLGAFPRHEILSLPERHLGLVPPQEHPASEQILTLLPNLAEKYLDLDGLWNLAASAPPLPEGETGKLGCEAGETGKLGNWETGTLEIRFDTPASGLPDSLISELPNFLISQSPLRIGLIRDSAFHFYYPENLEALEARGARLVEISALDAPRLPEVDALYVGGGFPETHAARLAANEGFRTSLRQAIDEGLPVVAECGGLIYLSEGIQEGERFHPLVGVFPVAFVLDPRPQGHGYTLLEADEPNPFFPVGTTLKGHEFRYSRVLRCGPLRTAFRVARGYGFDGQREGLIYRNVLATFTHVHASGAPEWADALVRRAAACRLRTANCELRIAELCQ
jgi:cobyrinic acid a,c-diamide synthase